MRSSSFSLRPLRWASRPTSPAPPSHPRLRCSLLGLGRTPWSPTHPSLRPRWPARSSPPPPPSAPVLRFAVFPPPTTNSAQQPLDSLLHLFPNHVADHSDQTLPLRHTSPPGSAYSSISRTCLPSRKVVVRHWIRSEEHTSELQSQSNLVCRLLLEKKKIQQ